MDVVPFKKKKLESPDSSVQPLCTVIGPFGVVGQCSNFGTVGL